MSRFVLLIGLAVMLSWSTMAQAQPSIGLTDPLDGEPSDLDWIIRNNSPSSPFTDILGRPTRGDGNSGDAVFYVDGQIINETTGTGLVTNGGGDSQGNFDNPISTFIGGEFTLVVSTNDTQPNGNVVEESVPHSVSYFPLSSGWIGGVIVPPGLVGPDASLLGGTLGGGSVTSPAIGQFDITGLGPGNLMVSAAGNGANDLLSTVYDNASDTWSVYTTDIVAGTFPTTAPIPGVFSFVHFAADAPGVYAGEFAADGSVSNLSDAAIAEGVSVSRTDVGNYQLTLGDGSVINPNTAAVFYTNAGTGADSDNFLTFDSEAVVGDSFNAVVWDVATLGPTDGPVRFAVLPFDTTGVAPSPAGSTGPDPSVAFIEEGPPGVPWEIRNNSTPIPLTDIGGDPTSADGNRGDAVYYVDGNQVTYADGAPLATTGGSLSQENVISTFIGGEGTLVVSTVDTQPDGTTLEEQSQSHSFGFFPYADGWTAGRVDGNGTLLDGTLPAGASFFNVATGTYEITGLGPGHLMTSAVGNGEDDLLSTVYDPASDTWTVLLHDNAAPDAVLANGDFTFVHFAQSAGDIFAGEIAADGTLSNLSDAAAALGVTISQLDTGSYEIVIGDGSQINPSTAALFLSAAGIGDDADNFVSFNSQAFNGNAFNAFVWEAPELQLGVGSEAVNGPLRFVIIPFDTSNVTPLTEGTSPGVIPEPSSLALFGLLGVFSLARWRR